MPMIYELLIILAGMAVYAGYGAAGMGYLAAVTVLSYAAGRLIPRYPRVMWAGVGATALILVAVKLQPVTGLELPAVMGISYFTLKVISYLADLYKGRYLPEKNFLRYALYVTYLPQLFLGPIERYDRFREMAFGARQVNWDGLSSGGARILWGLFKKLVIAARAGVVISRISSDPAQYRGFFALAAMVLYYLQLYADFSGGIDIVIGVSRMLGFGASENFRQPWQAESVREFWRRWHITLGSWLRDYVYIPLGGNRRGTLRNTLNTLITFLVSGLWHGVHYLLWGLLNGLLVVAGDRCRTKSVLLNRVGTFAVISLLWAFFIWPDTKTALEMILSVFTAGNFGAFFGATAELGLSTGEWLALAAGVDALWGVESYWEAMVTRYSVMRPAGRVAVLCSLGLLILVFGMYGIGFDVDAFIYSRF